MRFRVPLLAVLLFLGAACGQEFKLPPQPEPQRIPVPNEYFVERVWSVPHPTDLVSQGSFLYVIEDESRIRSYLVESLEIQEPSFIGEFEGLIHPVQLAVARRDSTFLFVADAGDTTIKRYHFTGGPPRFVFRDSTWTGFSGLAADNLLNVYVSSADGNTIYKYDAEGRRDRLISDRGTGTGFVISPNGMHWNGDHLIVADTGKNWVQRILTDTTNVAATGDPIGLDFELSMPLDVTSDRAKDFIFVADTGSDRVLKFLTTGAFEDSVSTRFDDDARLGGVPVLAPRYIAAEGSVVFVSDTENDRIVRFRLASPAVGGATE